MDSVDPIKPLSLTANSGHLHIAQTNKDGRHQSEQEHKEHPHDVLELHDQEIELKDESPQEPPEEPEIGLDLAV